MDPSIAGERERETGADHRNQLYFGNKIKKKTRKLSAQHSLDFSITKKVPIIKNQKIDPVPIVPIKVLFLRIFMTSRAHFLLPETD